MHPVTVFIERFRAAVSVLVGPCCPGARFSKLLKIFLSSSDDLTKFFLSSP